MLQAIPLVRRLEPVLWSIKYSPRTWDEFVGQDEATHQLKNMAESKTAHNMIFLGPSGTGKSCAAHIFARELLGETFSANFQYLNTRDLRDIPVSKAKRDLAALAKLDRSERTELDEFMSVVYREAKTAAALKGRSSEPNKSQLLHEAIRMFASTVTVSDEMIKYLVLDEADALDKNMQQALRRTMEMYSDACRFILITPSLAGWSPAVVSRCLVLRFPALSQEAVVALLRDVAAKEHVRAEDAAFAAIAQESFGDMRRALNLLQVSASGVTKVTEDIVYGCSETPIVSAARRVVSLAAKGSFAESRDLMKDLLAVQGYTPDEVCLQIQRDIVKRPLDDATKDALLQRIAEIDFRMTQGKNPFIHLSALLASVGDILSDKKA